MAPAGGNLLEENMRSLPGERSVRSLRSTRSATVRYTQRQGSSAPAHGDRLRAGRAGERVHSGRRRHQQGRPARCALLAPFSQSSNLQNDHLSRFNVCCSHVRMPGKQLGPQLRLPAGAGAGAGAGPVYVSSHGTSRCCLCLERPVQNGSGFLPLAHTRCGSPTGRPLPGPASAWTPPTALLPTDGFCV